MTSSFTITSESERKYYSDDVRIEMIINGEQARLIDGDLDQDVEDIELRVTVNQVWEQVGASDKRPGQLWLDFLSGSEITFKPDSDGSSSFIILPDLRHVATAVRTRTGIYMRKVSLRFFSKSSYQPTDSVMTNLIGLMPFFQGD